MQVDGVEEVGANRLTEQKRLLLDRLKGKTSSPRQTTIPRRTEQERPPLSFAQRRLWFLDRMVPGSSAYNVAMTFTLRGRLDTAVLQRAVDEIVRRHETLRTTIAEEEGEAWQRIAPAMSIPVTVVDLAAQPDAQARLDALIAEEARAPFDLDRGPLLRITVYALGDGRYVVLMLAHHITVDGWSLGLFWQELLALYDAFLAGRPSPLPELAIQYADFSEWQHEQLRGPRLKADLDYWREHLAGVEPSDLPLDRPRPPVQTFVGGDFVVPMTGPLRRKLDALCKRAGVSVFVVLLAGLQAMLHRYTGQRAVAVGSPVTNRTRVEIEPLIGLFVNTLVYKADIDGDTRFVDLLARVRDTVNGAQSHQEVPFEALVEALAPERYLSMNPLFQVCFNLLPQRGLPSSESVAVEDSSGVRNGGSKFDLWIGAIDQGDRLLIEVEYNSVVFEEATVRRMLESWRLALEAVADDPERTVAQLPMMDAATRRLILEDWNATARTYADGERKLHDIIVGQCRRTPSAVALVHDDAQMTYGELERRSGQLAVYLQGLGVGAESFVGLFLERSTALVTSVVGVMRAGAAYLPLEPAYPAARIASMIEDARPPVVLTTRRLAARLPDTEARVVLLDGDDAALIEACSDMPAGGSDGELAYLMYTSGSTGRPKGVMNTHTGIVNRLLWMQEQYGLTSDDTVLHKTPFGFDVSVWELCWPLMVGSRMVIAAPDRHADPAYLADLIDRTSVTTLHFVPSILEAFMAEPDLEERCSSVRRVICSGEALPYTLQQRVFDRLAGVELHNLYGPTEAAIDVTAWACRSDGSETVPIGRPVANTQIYILDAHLNPVPIGVIGELYIGGVQVARGYLNRPELTRERFLADPFSERPGALLYKTGDLARYRPDGTIEYRGRIDTQVKLHGVRIELGEIEAAIEQHAGVRQAVVLAQKADDDPSGAKLVAYVVPERETEAAPDVVEDWRTTFDIAYTDPQEGAQDDLHLGGWASSFSGEDFGPEVMRDYIDCTVERILALKPRRVLEIGCGTGLILSRVAARCETYVGTDISPTALRFVRDRLVARRPELAHVELHQASADDFGAIGDEPFDLVVLNSVVQYFSDIRYLRGVLAKALDRLDAGGCVFVGDVRHLGVLPAFHAELEASRAPAALSVGDLRRRIARQSENELVVDPAFFSRLKRDEPRIGQVEVQLRRGRRSDEMTRYRYDAVLRLAAGAEAARSEPRILDWDRDDPRLDRIESDLQRSPDPAVAVLGVPNARLRDASALVRALAEADEGETVGELGYRLWAARPLDGQVPAAVDPEAWWQLAERTGRTAVVTWMPDSADGDYAVFLLAQGAAVPAMAEWPRFEDVLDRPLDEMATDPAFDRRRRTLASDLRGYLRDRLPSHMCPASFVSLGSLPVTANGKLDRSALEALAPDREEQPAAVHREPRTQTERVLGEVWAEVLGTGAPFDADANFFELGGDSIRSVQVVSKAQARGIELTPQMMFRYDTLADLAAAVDAAGAATAEAEPEAEPVPAGSAAEAPTARPAPRGTVTETYPLTPFQQWALALLRERRTPGLFQVHRCTTVPLSVATADVFRQALEDQTQAHPLLRTAFDWSGDEPRQNVYSQAAVEFRHENWRDLSEPEQDAALERYLAQDRERGIEPEVPGAMRYFMAELDSETCLCVMSFSFLCLDGWSYNLLTDELLERLDALNNGRVFRDRPGMALSEFVAHAARIDKGPAEAYWRETLRTVDSCARLPTLASPPDTGSVYAFSRQFAFLPEAVSTTLRDAARRRHVPLNVLFQASWAVVLAAQAGQLDVVHGVLLAGRSSGPVGVETMVGPTLNILPLRTAVDPSRPIEDYLKSVMSALVKVGEFELVGLHDVLEWGGLPAFTPPNQSYLVFQNVGMHNSQRFGAGYFFSKLGYPIRVDVFPADVISLHVSYDRSRFDDQAGARLLHAFRATLEALADNPDGTVSGLLEAARLTGAEVAPDDVVREGAAQVRDVRAASSA